jgi:putative RecB family exonuclease
MPLIDDVLGTGLAHRSVSQVSSFAQCGEAYRLSRVAQVPSKPAAWFYHGTAYHAVIEEYENTGRTLSPRALVDLFVAHYREEVAKAKALWPDETHWLTGGRKKGFQDVEDREAIGSWQVLDYVEFAEAHKDEWRILPMGDGKIATEVRFDTVLGGVNVMGFIDQIRQYRDGSLAVADLKTGSSTPGSSMQLGVYAHVAEEQTGIRPEVGIFIKAGRPATARTPEKPTKDIPHSPGDWTPELLGDMFKNMDRMDKLGLFLPNPQDGCERTCTVAEHCRIKGYGPGRAEFATIRTRTRQTA